MFLRGTIINRTYGTHKNLYIFLTNNIWSYLLGSSVIGYDAPCSERSVTTAPRPKTHAPRRSTCDLIWCDCCREVRPEGHERLSWIEAYLSGHPKTVVVDPIDNVASVINRVTTLEVRRRSRREAGRQAWPKWDAKTLCGVSCVPAVYSWHRQGCFRRGRSCTLGNSLLKGAAVGPWLGWL